MSLPKLIPLSPFPADSNPFCHDSFHMGTRMGKDLIVMHANHTEEDCKYLIFCNTKTGERFRLEFEGAAEAVAHGQLVDDVLSGRK